MADNLLVRLRFDQRVIEPEWLDELPPGEGRASLKDLEKINRRWGGYASTRRLLNQTTRPDEPFSLLDVGAASGDIGRWIRRIRPRAAVTSIDRLTHHLERAEAPKAAADAFRLPFPDRSFDFVFSSLFLHHFAAPEIVNLLREFGRVASRGVLAVDLHRHPLAYHFLPWTQRLLGWDPVTVHDGPISVAAGFRKSELKALADRAELKRPVVHTTGISFRVILSAGSAESSPNHQTRNSVSR